MPMYAICSTRKGSVARHAKMMKEMGYSCPLMQFRANAYDELSKDRERVLEAVATLHRDYVVDINKGVLHKKDCDKVTVAMARNEAHIIDPKTTGLKMCKCMRKK